MTRQNSVKGSVVVVGGGIAGIQSALDLSDTGFLVHLIEKSPAIGGIMSALDKTFPTNDCSMCILSPKLVEVSRNTNITLHTNSEVLDIQGDAGNFQVQISTSPRYIDAAKCISCGECAAVCPVDLPDNYNEALSLRKAVYKPYAQAVPGAYAIEKSEIAPCETGCPAGVNVQGYIQMVKQGKYKEAIDIIMKDIPFPGVLGRVCSHPCESRCKRRDVDTSVSIRELKRVAADQVNLCDLPLPETTPQQKKVAVIGSGPAGLSAAYFLALEGYHVTVYESMPEPGGMMRYGIPEHRLPRTVLDAEIEYLKRLGVEIVTHTAIGKDISLKQLKEKNVDAIFLGLGAWKSLKMGIPGEDADGVMDAAAFLKAVHLGNLTKIKGKAVIIGGSQSAFDSARVARQLGAEEVHILYDRLPDQIPAGQEEAAQAKIEGIEIHYCAAPKKIEGSNGKVTGICCIKTSLSEPDSTGRRKPVPIDNSEFSIMSDVVIHTAARIPDLDFLKDDSLVSVSKRHLLQVNNQTLQTDMEGIFAGGDAVTGPATIIEAVEAGKTAAKHIDGFLRGIDVSELSENNTPSGTHRQKIQSNKPEVSGSHTPAEQVSTSDRTAMLTNGTTASEEAGRCLNCGGCCECFQCIPACKAEAVTLTTHSQKQTVKTLEAGAVIMAPGTDIYRPVGNDLYGYGVHPNVVTAKEFERILSASGPYSGHLVRPSDNTPPAKIAWLQCVGSRSIKDNEHPYCSGVCCMYAIKEAVIAKEHAGKDLDTAIFYMDMRTHGKEFEKTRDRAEKESKVRFIRSRVHSVEAIPGSEDLNLMYVGDDGSVIYETFNMVVLSTGMEISHDIKELSRKLDIRLNTDGFAETSCFNSVNTSSPGIYVCGAFSEPKDIPQSVVDASAAASAAAVFLSSSRYTLTREKTVPSETDVTGLPPRIGVFVCHCGSNIGGVVNVPDVIKYAAQLPHVVFTADSLFTCSQDAQEGIKKVIVEHQLNRVVIASCSPRTHEALFQETIQEAGMNPYLLEFTNIRDQNAWVHMYNPEAATSKAKDLIRMAAAKVALLEPLQRLEIQVNPDALIIGGGIAGMTAALTLAQQGFKSILVEKQDTLGGVARTHSLRTWKGDTVDVHIKELRDSVLKHNNINVMLSSDILSIDGFVGNFTTTLSTNGQQHAIEHGVVILATGGKASEPGEYLYGQTDRVLKWRELTDLMEKDPTLPDRTESVAFIQCVGSREPGHPYCSRICCTASVQSAITLKQKKPGMQVYILYRDIRTYGMRETLYQKARELGVIFIRYNPDHKPVVEKDGDQGLVVTVKDHILKQMMKLKVDYVCLATAIEPDYQKELAQMLKVPANEDGFFMEAHMKLRPVDFSTDGVYLCGLAHYPKPVEETIAQAQAAANRAAGLLVKPTIHIEPIVSQVDQEMCIGCGLCEDSCSYGAIRLKQVAGVGFRAENYPALCKGCGVCAAACPQQAIDMKHFSNKQIMAAIKVGVG